MLKELYKNPLIIGIIFGAITYLYIWWTDSKDNEEDDIDDEREESFLSKYKIIIPIIVTLVVWGIAYFLLNRNKKEINIIETTDVLPQAQIGGEQNIVMSDDIVKSSSSDSIKSYNLISKGLNIPNKLPDAFIEIM